MLTDYQGDKAGFVILPNLVVAVEASGNIVLRTAERVVTITDVNHLIEVLKTAKAIRDDNFEAYRASTVTPTYQAADGRPGA